MKKRFLFSMMIMAVFAIGFTASDNEDKQNGQNPEQPLSELEQNWMTIDGASFTDGTFPTPTIPGVIEGLTINTQALQGGGNIITVTTAKAYVQFYVGVVGVPGYLVYTPKESEQVPDAAGLYHYTIPVKYSTNIDITISITMLISAKEDTGDVTQPYEAIVKFVDSQYEAGELTLNMTFNNEKDVDLHLWMPSGKHIYYGDRGGTVTIDGQEVTFGLDKDSNAGCNIDGLNNENIVIPAPLVENGTYRVVVDMYANCDTSIPTSWMVLARYKGQLITVNTGSNPALGVYPIGAPNGDMTNIMEFTITDGAINPVSAPSRAAALKFVPTPLSDMDQMKLEEAQFRLQNK